MLDKHRAYFDKKALTYSVSSSRFPWALLRRMEASTVFECIGNISGEIFLEYGCGSGYYTNILLKKKAKKVFAMDLSEAMLNSLPDHKNLIKEVSDVSKLRLNMKFNNIISCGMLEFVESVPLALENFTKHASSDSNLIILVPRRSFFGYLYFLYHFINGNKIRLFDSKELVNLLKNQGWEIKVSKRAGIFSCVIKAKKKT